MFIRFMIGVAGLCGALAVAMGALHSHGLDRLLLEQGYEAADVADRMQLCDTANKYLVLHAGALLGCAALLMVRGGLVIRLAATGLMLGMVGFCGSLYMLTFTTEEIWSNAAPVGGITLIFSWLLVALSSFAPHYKEESEEI